MHEGTQVGAYRVLRRIGSGGMGDVWLAEHTMLGRRAAIKVLHAEYSSRSEIVTRFFNEARAATAISDPGIVQIFDFGQHTDGSAYIVMELLDGETLGQRLQSHGVLAVDDALRIMRQVASSLGAAHVRGIVHRDLKPENIFLVRDPEVPSGERAKILDFGIAKLVGDTNVKTSTSAVMGTPTYMSPEQCRGAGQVDQRSDVYSLGCVLFTLITGRPPFTAEGVGDIIAMHLREPAPAPSSFANWIPHDVDRLVMCCLAKDPSQRFSSGSELAAAIGAMRNSAPSITSPSARKTAVPESAGAQTTLSTAAGMSSAPAPKRSRAWIVATLAVTAVGGAIVVIATRGSSESPSPPPPIVMPAAPPTPPPPDPNIELANGMKDVLRRFVTWSADHAGAPCPDAATLGAVQDPWGHPIQITCSEQPGDQIIGAISGGPDGVIGTADDVASWQLDRTVSAIVHGSRWVVVMPAAPTESSIATHAGGAKKLPTAKQEVAAVTPTQPPKPEPPTPEPPSGVPAVATPAEPALSPQLDPAMIKAGMLGVRSRLFACRNSIHRPDSPEITPGTVIKLHIQVAPDGSITSTRVDGSPDDYLSSCMKQTMKWLKFAKTRDGGSFSYPITFN